MRLKISKSKHAQSLYVIRSTYVNGKHFSKVVEKLGTYDELKKLHPDPIAWAKEYIQSLNEQEKAASRDVILRFKQSKSLPKDRRRLMCGGYLFLQQLYHQLRFPQLCESIARRHKFQFNLDAILSRLIYSRVLYPSSKVSTFQFSQMLLEPPDFQLHQIYRALGILAQESDFIQAQLYRTGTELGNHNNRILYYDCTNFFFEIEQEDGFRQYGPSKEHRPNPIVEMGLFLDGDGIPLAFCIHSGNTNEQVTLQPLEEKILRDFSLSQFVVCTDSGLSSLSNRQFNTKGGRAFLTTQSLKKLKGHLRQWALNPKGWHLCGSSDRNEYNLDDINACDAADPEDNPYRSQTFFKERWINEDDLEQHLIVTFSLKYKHYQQHIRNQQIQRACQAMETHVSSLKKYHANDFKRFIKKTRITPDGEVAEKEVYTLDQERIEQEAKFDGFYAVCTSLDDAPQDIIRLNQRRWEIEESFRIMKTEFKARPVYLSREDRIRAHFLICFLSLMIYRYLEKKTHYAFTTKELITGIRNLNFLEAPTGDYIPTYTRTDVTDALHEAFGFRTDYEVLSASQMKKIIKASKP